MCVGVGKYFWDFNPQFPNHILMCAAVVLGWERQASDIDLIFNFPYFHSLSFYLMIIVLFPSTISRRFRKSSNNNIFECEKFWIAQNKQLTFHELVSSVIGVRRSKLSSTEHFFMVIFFNEQFAAIFNNFSSPCELL